jgi:hypothetical protein
MGGAMSSIVVLGDTSGGVTLQAPAVAGTVTVTLPATSGTMAVSGASQSFTDVAATGNLTVDGNAILGNASTDTLNVGNGGLVKDASGNVGIGTASPSSYGKLVSLGSDNATLFAAVGATNMLRVQGYNSTYVGTLLESVNLAQSANTPLFINGSTIRFGISGTTQTTIDSSGNVGIGATSPRFKVSIGTIASTSTATPDTVDIGATYSSTAGANAKLRIWTDSVQYMGIGVSGNQLDYICTSTYSHVFYNNGAERMRIDSSGRVTTPYQPAFRAIASANTNYSTSGVKITVYDTAVLNTGSHYNASTQRFTAPVAGVYIFTARAWALQGNTTEAGIQITINGVGRGSLRIGSSRDGYSTLQPMTYVSLAAGDYAEVYTESASATGQIHTSAGEQNSMFAGYLLG